MSTSPEQYLRKLEWDVIREWIKYYFGKRGKPLTF